VTEPTAELHQLDRSIAFDRITQLLRAWPPDHLGWVNL
jgi:hypothetical protein